MNKLSEVAALLREAADKLESTTPEPMAKPAPKFKKGDKVRHRINGQRGTVIAATDNPPFECAVDWGVVGGAYVESALELDETPAPASPEPKAGQVWVDDGGGQTPSSVYMLTCWADSWQPINMCGFGYWGQRRKTAAEAVRGLTFAAPTVAEFYQRDLLARVAELEKEVTKLTGFQTTNRECEIEHLRLALGVYPDSPKRDILWIRESVADMRKLIEPALAAARLEQLDQQGPSEAECIVWAMRKGQLYPAERGDYGKKVWVYLGEDESVEIDAGLRHDAPKLESDTLADIRRRMKESANGIDRQ